MLALRGSLLLAMAVCLVGCRGSDCSVDVAPVHLIGAAPNICACKQNLEGNHSVERITDLSSFRIGLSLVTEGKRGHEITAIIEAIQTGCGFTTCCCSEDLHALGYFHGSASSATKDRISDLIIDSRLPGTAIPLAWPAGAGDLQYAPNCTLYPGKRVIVVTVNIDFFDMFRNWFHTAMTYIDNKTDQLVVYPYDELVMLKLRNMNLNSSVPFKIWTQQHARRLANWATPEYGRLVSQRPALLKSWLDQNCTVFYVDIDTVWVRPIFPAMMAAAGSRSLYLVGDQGLTTRHYYCTCFMYANPVPEVKKLMVDWLASIQGQTQNQPPFNRVLKNSYVDYAVLPRKEFPDGWFADAHDLNKSAVVLHANFRVGLPSKTTFFKKRGFWFV